MPYRWDLRKSEANTSKHGRSFEDAHLVLEGTFKPIHRPSTPFARPTNIAVNFSWIAAGVAVPGATQGIYIENADNVLVQNSQVNTSGNGQALFATGAENLQVRNNVSTGGAAGTAIEVEDDENALIVDNTMQVGGCYGIAVCALPGNCSGEIVAGNYFGSP